MINKNARLICFMYLIKRETFFWFVHNSNEKKILVRFKHLTCMINIGLFYAAGSKISNSNKKCPFDLFYGLDQK